MVEHRQLNALSLAALLVSAHYGLGFLLGTGEKAFTLGMAGSLYAISIALGTIALLALAKFYWENVEQIWTLLGQRYGRGAQILVGSMSWLSLIGIEAVQTIAGVSILNVVGAPALPTTIALTLVFLLVSLLPVEKASRLFQALLACNLCALFYSLIQLHGLGEYARSPLAFIPSLQQAEPASAIGISLCTILLVLIDMKYQQYIVRAKDLKNLYIGCILAAFILFALALLPSAVVISAQNAEILPPETTAKAAIPYILSWVGGGITNPLGILLIISLIVPALGVGSSILRMQTKTILDFGFIEASNVNRFAVASANAILGFMVALRGGSIVNLIVQFYAVYVATIMIPFVAYLLASFERYIFSSFSVYFSLGTGGAAAISMLVLTLIDSKVAVLNSPELTIMGMGFGFGVLGLLVGQAIAIRTAPRESSEPRELS
ncbi:hypothetical protein [Oscillatoria sp. FACHB-1406]|uniref:hypothetical protein n=1 Tax=Oscillatoria sp. FACHB-1406 TaxID=2692846 RepID=UPI001685335E|nr:hypothetical protein [Oscillatoria sp. FACHB-1406]MBD2578257.1 hypothetical protein [Oscillatoria sp. FACHB-1406]